MTSNRTHTCVYFDDGGPEHVCVCGSRALLVLDEDGTEGVLVALLDESTTVTALTARAQVPARTGELAVSA
jgi:hypothetical protein